MARIMEIARRRKLRVVEDCAQSIGAAIEGKNTGSFGDIGCFSFFPSKNLGAYGDGGLATTDSPDLADRMRALRAHGGRVKYHHEELGVNSRLDELQAAILRVKLPHLESWTESRRAVAARYEAAFAGNPHIVTPLEAAGCRNVYHQYTIRVTERERVAAALKDAGVQTMVYYPVPLHLQKVHAHLGKGEGSFPHSEAAAKSVLSLPMFPELRPEAQDQVIAAVREAVAKAASFA
jgi:dTDP-4-amino-4,6-dideoxygalactose transaminase